MNETLERLLDGTFLFVIVPLFLFIVGYGVRVRWQETLAGKLIFTVACALFFSFCLSVAVIVWPHWAQTTEGFAFRISVRFVLGCIFWYCFFLFWRTFQKNGKGEAPKLPPPSDPSI